MHDHFVASWSLCVLTIIDVQTAVRAQWWTHCKQLCGRGPQCPWVTLFIALFKVSTAYCPRHRLASRPSLLLQDRSSFALDSCPGGTAEGGLSLGSSRQDPSLFHDNDGHNDDKTVPPRQPRYNAASTV